MFFYISVVSETGMPERRFTGTLKIQNMETTDQIAGREVTLGENAVQVNFNWNMLSGYGM